MLDVGADLIHDTLDFGKSEVSAATGVCSVAFSRWFASLILLTSRLGAGDIAPADGALHGSLNVMTRGRSLCRPIL
jgi:hypothetical protein